MYSIAFKLIKSHIFYGKINSENWIGAEGAYNLGAGLSNLKGVTNLSLELG